MIDRLISAKAKDVFADDYSPSQAVQGKTLHNPNGDKLALLCGPWHGGGRIIERLENRLQSNNYAVLEYDFHDQILEPNIERVLQSYEMIQAKIATDLYALHEDGYKRIHLIGISLGNVAMALVASEFPEFTSAASVLPGSKLSSSMWDGSRTQNIRRLLEEKGHTKAELEDAWHYLEPRAYADAFRHKPVTTIISTTDKIILPKYQFEMNQELISAGAIVSDNYSRLGHGASVINYCFRGNI